MGTTYTVKVASKKSVTNLKTKVESVLKKVNQQMSTYIKDSEISNLNRMEADTPLKLSNWFYTVLSYSLELSQKTKGVYDPTIGPLVNLWGFGPQKRQEVPTQRDILEVKKHVGFDKIHLVNKKERWHAVKKDKAVYIDLSSSAKGFGVDKVSELLSLEGFNNHLVEIGGELKAKGLKFGRNWMVAVESPQSSLNKRVVQKVVSLQNLSVATSGDYRNFFTEGKLKYSHTISRKTGKPIQNKILSVSVVEESCMKADALATAIMALGVDEAKKFIKSEGLAVHMIIESDLPSKKHKSFSSIEFLSLTNVKKKEEM